MMDFDSFGKGAASEDHARSEEHDDPFFVQTRSARTFLDSQAGIPFVAGSKGAGKSLLLFKRRMDARQTSGSLVLPATLRAFIPSQAFADLVALSHYWQLWDENGPRLASWTALWQWALMRTIVSGWRVHSRRHRNEAHIAKLRRLAASCDEDFDLEAPEDDPFALVRRTLERMDAGHAQSRGMLKLPSSDDYAAFVTANADEFPQTYVFVDNHDDFFEKNADFWVASATGTFLASRFLREISGGRIHFFATMRPEVVWRLQQEDNFLVYTSEIHKIEWQPSELLELFSRRIRRLKRELLRSPEVLEIDPIKALLGSSLARRRKGPALLRNRSAEAHDPIYEDAGEYILRNTLRRPRDLIVMGNQILEHLQKASPETSDWSSVLQGIDAARKLIAQAYVAEVRNRWPWPHHNGTSLPSFLARLPRNIIHHSQAADLEREFLKSCPYILSTQTPLQVLASLALLGHVVDQAGTTVQRFAVAGETSHDTLPKSDWYVVNPVLYGDPFNVTVLRGIVVGSGLEFDKVYAEQLILQRHSFPPSDELVAAPPVLPETAEVSAPALKPKSDPALRKEPTRVVFLAANPSTLNSKRLENEVRAVKQSIGLVDRSHRLALFPEWSVSVNDMLRAIQEHKPQVVHFSGHGADGRGIFLHQDSGGGAVLVASRALQRIFGALRPVVRLVVLNACSTDEQAEAIAKEIEFAVGTKDDISDEAARAFATAFYGALAFGQCVQRSFDLGAGAVEASARGYADYFSLHHREGCDAAASYIG